MSPDVLNKDALLARVGGDAALLGAMAALFLEECPKYLDDVRQAVVGHDAPALERAAHALKGSVSNFRALATEHAAQTLEQMGRAGDLTGVERALRDLESAVERLTPVLKELM